MRKKVRHYTLFSVSLTPLSLPRFSYYYDGDTLIAVPFEILSSLIRMAHKYAVQDVLDHALSRLKKYYTNDLAAWRDVSTRARYVTAKDMHAFGVIQLARLTNTPSLLPTAFLTCTKILTSRQLKGRVPVALGISLLPVPDQLLLISAREELLHTCSERTLRLLAAVPRSSCTTPAACRAAREAPLSAIRERNAFPEPPISHRDVLAPMAMTLWDEMHWDTFCGTCQVALVATDEAESRWIWKNLPGSECQNCGARSAGFRRILADSDGIRQQLDAGTTPTLARGGCVRTCVEPSNLAPASLERVRLTLCTYID